MEKARERRRPTTTKPTTTTTATTTYLARRRRPRRLVITCTELVVRTTFSISPYRLIREPFAPPYFATRTRTRIIPSRRPRRCRSRHRIVHPTYDRRNHAELTLVICSLCDRFLEPPPPFQHRTTPLSLGATLIPLVPWCPGPLVVRIRGQTRPAHDNGTADKSTPRRYDDATALANRRGRERLRDRGESEKQGRPGRDERERAGGVIIETGRPSRRLDGSTLTIPIRVCHRHWSLLFASPLIDPPSPTQSFPSNSCHRKKKTVGRRQRIRTAATTTPTTTTRRRTFEGGPRTRTRINFWASKETPSQ